MFSKILASATLLLVLSSQAAAHMAVAPMLGVGNSPQRSDVKRPSTANPCGQGVNIASTLDSSVAVTAGADGSVQATAINFNAGADGSEQVVAKVDPTGQGKNFVAMTVTKNGDPAPKTVAQAPIVAQLPAGTKCTGGSAGNKCLVQFVSSAGFGNCVVVTQGGATAPAKGSTAAVASGAAAGAVAGGAAGKAVGGSGAVRAGAAAGANKGANTPDVKAKHGHKGDKNGSKKTGAKAQSGTGANTAKGGEQAGTRAARALRLEMIAREVQ